MCVWARAVVFEQLEVPDCFLELPGMDCEETNAYIRTLGSGIGDARSRTPRRAVPSGEVQWMKGLTSMHAVGATTRMDTYYSTWETVDMATAFVRPDLIAFEYPILMVKGAHNPVWKSPF